MANATIPNDPRKVGEVYADRFGGHQYRVVAILGADAVPAWFPGWGITVQHSYDGGRTYEAPVTHCTDFNARRYVRVEAD